MFLGHLPAGYLASRWLSARMVERSVSRRRLALLGMACSLLPDLDLVYFYTIDQRQHLHHSYWSHIPCYWSAIFGALALLAAATRWRRALPALGMAASAVLLHLLLDTVTGGIRWLIPLSNATFALVDIPARYDWWIANFLLHWTVLLDVGLIGWALVVWRRGGVAQAKASSA